MNLDDMKIDYVPYDSPIFTVIESHLDAMGKQIDGQVMKAVGKIGINIDKDKLLSCLNQDKHRYQEAYQRGYAARENDIIRCKDCKNSIEPCDGWDRRCKIYGVVCDDFYCADAVKKDDSNDD